MTGQQAELGHASPKFNKIRGDRFMPGDELLFQGLQAT